jgi:division protein CdvB (Snf7/Vps24/ESCRT-III family)
MISNFFKKFVLFAMTAALLIAAVPVTNVSAAGEYDPPTPPANGQIANERLERIWTRELKVYERLGKAFDRSDTFIEKVQARIDQAAKNGKDVTAVQAALDAFEAAVKDAHPIYENAKGIINSHKGFDENGKVKDPEQAKETVRDMRDKLNEIKSTMGGTLKALHQAIKAFREANKPAVAPTQQGI